LSQICCFGERERKVVLFQILRGNKSSIMLGGDTPLTALGYAHYSQFYLQIKPCLSPPRKRSLDGATAD